MSREASPSEDEFRAEVLDFLRTTLPPKGGTGPDSKPGANQAETGRRPGSGRPARHPAGGGLPACPGRRRTGRHHLAGRVRGTRVCPAATSASSTRRPAAFQVPPRSLEIGLGMCGPTVLVHGSEEQKRALVPPLLRGEHVWCELFSEPGAGSDLSSVQTRARRDGDEFVVDGQKVWTSGAQHSDYAACLTRTDSSRPKREGITMLIVDMHDPGITVRPLRQLTGESHFNEVFLDGVRVPGGQRPRADRRRVAGRPHHARLRTPGPQRHRFERRLAGRLQRPGRRGQAPPAWTSARPSATAWCSCAFEQMVLRYLTSYLQVQGSGRGRRRRGVDAQAGHGATRAADRVGPWSRWSGMDAIAWRPDDPDGGRWSFQLLNSLSASLGGGTNEIVRNVIAERRPRSAQGRGGRPHAGGGGPCSLTRSSGASAWSRWASTWPHRWPRRSSPTWAPRWSRSSVRAATPSGPTPPASPPGTGASRRSSST